MSSRSNARDARGFYGIGVYMPKSGINIGTLFRTAVIYEAAFVFTVGRRYNAQASDTVKSWRHVPLVNYATIDDLLSHLPHDAPLIGVELDARARLLENFVHPERAVYMLGAEDSGLSERARTACHHLVQMPGRFCMNVAVAGSIVIYDRVTQRHAV